MESMGDGVNNVMGMGGEWIWSSEGVMTITNGHYSLPNPIFDI